MSAENKIRSPLNWYQVMDKMIGENKQRFVPLGTPGTGIPPAQPIEHVRVQKFFESCAFKTGISCVGGKEYHVTNSTKISILHKRL